MPSPSSLPATLVTAAITVAVACPPPFSLSPSLLPPSPTSSPATLVAIAIARLIVVSLLSLHLGLTSLSSSPPRPRESTDRFDVVVPGSSHRCCCCCADNPPPVTATEGVDRPRCAMIAPPGIVVLRLAVGDETSYSPCRNPSQRGDSPAITLACLTWRGTLICLREGREEGGFRCRHHSSAYHDDAPQCCPSVGEFLARYV